MPESAFTPHGPEGRPREAHRFEDQLEVMSVDLGWQCLERNTDLLTGSGQQSSGLDLVWAVTNPLTGRGEAWIGDGKRHDSSARYTTKLLDEEVHSARGKIAKATTQRFLNDPRVAPYIHSVGGALIFHRTPGYDRNRVGRALGRIELRHKAAGAQTPRVLVIGSDTLNGLAETIRRFGSPEAFFWPSVRGYDAAWSPACPPGQLARGLIVYRSGSGKTVLWLRGGLDEQDIPMLVDLVYLIGDIDDLAATELTVEERSILERQWHRAAQQTWSRQTGRLPKSPHALELGGSGMGPFDAVWPADGTTHGSAVDEAKKNPTVIRHPARRAAGARRVVASAYPLPGRLAEAVKRKATLGSARSALAEAGVVSFSNDKSGIAAAFEEGLLLPSTCRRVADSLDLNVSSSIRGFEVARLPLPQLSLLPPASAIESFLTLVEQALETPLGGKQARLRCIEPIEGEWSRRLEIEYERIVDIDGGVRVLAPSTVELYVRAHGETVQIAVFTRRAADVDAARSWLHGLLSQAEQTWIPEPVGLPGSEPERSAVVASLLTRLGEFEVVGVGHVGGSRDQLRAVETDDEFLAGMVDADYKTRALGLQSALRRIESDLNAFTSLTAYLWAVDAADGDVPVLAIQVRQPLDDSHLSLHWAAGRKAPKGAVKGVAALRAWDDLVWLQGWTEEKKRLFLLRAFSDVLENLRARADVDALGSGAVSKRLTA